MPKVTTCKFGDIGEFRTEEGLGYFQYTHNHKGPPRWGELIRVLRGVHSNRPDDLESLVEQPEHFYVFFTLRLAAKREEVEIVGNADVPQRCQAFPSFKMQSVDAKRGVFDGWWIWRNGQESVKVEKLSPKEEAYSTGPRIVNIDALVELFLVAHRRREKR